MSIMQTSERAGKILAPLSHGGDAIPSTCNQLTVTRLPHHHHVISTLVHRRSLMHFTIQRGLLLRMVLRDGKFSAAGNVTIHTDESRGYPQARIRCRKLCMSDGRVLAECSRRRPPRIDDVDGELCFQSTLGIQCSGLGKRGSRGSLASRSPLFWIYKECFHTPNLIFCSSTLHFVLSIQTFHKARKSSLQSNRQPSIDNEDLHHLHLPLPPRHGTACRAQQ